MRSVLCPLILALAAPSACAPAVGDGPERPDILMVSLDTVRWDHTSLAPNGPETTPNLARLSQLPGATTFDRAYSAASWSMPAYASLFTGTEAMTHGLGLTADALDPARATLAEALSAYGYQTAAFVSGPHLDPGTGVGRGFQLYSHDARFLTLGSQVDAALAWVAERAAAPEPYLLFVHGYDAHAPFLSPAVFSERFDPEGAAAFHTGLRKQNPKICDGLRLFPKPAARSCAIFTRGRPGAEPPTPAEVSHVAAHYNSAVSYADYHLGRLLHQMEQMGALEDTLIVVFSDHGDSLKPDGRTDETGGVSEGFLRVPLVIRRPSAAPPAHWGGLVSLSGLLPTLLTELGVVLPADIDGVSFRAPWLDPSLPPSPEAVVVGVSECCAAARTLEWELRGQRAVRMEHSGTGRIPIASPGAEVIWGLRAYGSEEDVADRHPEEVEALKAAIRGWPPREGADAERVNGPAAATPEGREMLRARGYWAPEPQKPPGASP